MLTFKATNQGFSAESGESESLVASIVAKRDGVPLVREAWEYHFTGRPCSFAELTELLKQTSIPAKE